MNRDFSYYLNLLLDVPLVCVQKTIYGSVNSVNKRLHYQLKIEEYIIEEIKKQTIKKHGSEFNNLLGIRDFHLENSSKCSLQDLVNNTKVVYSTELLSNQCHTFVAIEGHTLFLHTLSEDALVLAFEGKVTNLIRIDDQGIYIKIDKDTVRFSFENNNLIFSHEVKDFSYSYKRQFFGIYDE